jgi:hypothetical protein
MNCVFYRGELSHVRSFDINSSYPAAMLQEIPVGPYRMKVVNQKMVGQPLEAGIYRIVVEDTPRNLRFGFLGVKTDSLFTFPQMVGCEVYTTSEELVYAHSIGYKAYILDCLVSERVGTPFLKFITEKYTNRKAMNKRIKELQE